MASTPPTSNSSAATNVQNAQKVTGAAKSQNPQDLASPISNTPTMNSLAAAFSPPPGITADMLNRPAQDAVTPTLQNLSAAGIQKALDSLTDNNSDNPLCNELMRYATYTYNIAFKTAKPTIANSLFTTQKYNPTAGWITLIQTGGIKRGEEPEGIDQHSYFTQDFYIDNLRFKTVVGQSSTSRATNVMEIAFTITEPYGVSFLEELSDFVHVGLQEENYLEMCYLLELSFIGYDADGNATILKNHTKIIPFKLMTIKFTVTAAGAVYEVTAVPFGHQAFSDKLGFVPKDTTIYGKTLTELCNSAYPKSLASSINEDLKSQINPSATGTQPTISPSHKAMDFADTYEIEFVKTNINTEEVDIGSKIIAAPDAIDPKNTGMAGAEKDYAQWKKAKAKAILAGQFMNTVNNPSAKGPQLTIDKDKQSITFNSASAIMDCLENLIKGSEYIMEQFRQYENDCRTLFTNNPNASDAEIGKALNRPIKWFKIIPTITLDDTKYDHTRNCYRKNITFRVIPYLIYSNKLNIISNDFPDQGVNVRVVKEYNYIYTGKNTEILDFQLHFDASFINMVTFNADTQGISDANKVPEDASVKIMPPPYKAAKDPISSAHSVVTTANNSSPAVSTGSENRHRTRAGDLASSLYNPTDLIQIEVDIIGDPDFIKQDDVFYQPGITSALHTISTTARNTPAPGQPSAIEFDAGEVYFRFNFFVPTDYNLKSGLMQINRDENDPKFKRSMYTGLYRIMTVESVFVGGTFKQKVYAMRLAQEIMRRPTGWVSQG